MSLPELLGLWAAVISLCLLRYSKHKNMGKSPLFKSTMAKTAKTRDFLILLLQLLFVAGGMLIALWALNITVRVSSMTADELAQLNSIVREYTIIVFIIAGIASGIFIEFLFEIAEYRAEYNKNKRNEEIKAIAQKIWEDNGKQDGHDKEHWAQAEIVWDKTYKHRAIKAIITLVTTHIRKRH